MARFPGLQGFHQQWNELLANRTLHQQARTGSADFTLVEGDATGRRLCCRAQIRRVGEHHVRALAPGFGPYAFHVALPGVDHQLLGNRRGAGEGQHVDVHVQRQCLADGVAVARQDVEHTFRDAGIQRQLGDADRGQRGLFRRLEDERVAHRQGRGEFPAGHDQREVPRYDGRDHAGRFAGHQAQLILGRGGDFVVDLVDGFAAPAQGLRRAGNVDVQGIADRLAHVQGFKQGQLFGVLFEQAGKTDHGGLAFGRRQTRPDTGIERGASVFHGALGIGGVTTGNLAEQTAIDRADALECLAGNGVGVFAIDIGATFDFQVAGTLFPVGTGQGGHASVLLLLIRHPRSSRALSGILPGQPAFRPKASTTLNQPPMKFQYI
ncbi:hypothetical protein PS647_06286 [Pseudomonas fluorescens]|nr:hypothetical protein PS647_06286 [Pseudomonas fluorescens]